MEGRRTRYSRWDSGILIAVIFDAGARGLGYLVPWSRQLRLLIVIVMSFVAVLALIWWGGTVVVAEAKSFAGQMHDLFRHAEQMLCWCNFSSRM